MSPLSGAATGTGAATPGADPDAIERRTIRKLAFRLLPLLVISYFGAYLDRVNVGFAAITMNKAIGLSASAFGLGAGLFFVAYFLFEVPSNVALARFGARRWITRIMVTWAIVCGLTAFVTGPWSFYGARLLLGAAEAGFFPGVIFLLTLWFPERYRGRIVSIFLLAVPISLFVGSPISGLILHLDGWLGFAGWQWLFLLEAFPVLLLAVLVLTYLPDGPSEAPWLDAAERAWLETELEADRNRKPAEAHAGILETLANPRVLILSTVYFADMGGLYALGFWLPQIVRGFGLGTVEVGLVSAIPYVIGAAGMLAWCWSSDRLAERRLHVAVALALLAIGLVGGGLAHGLAWKMAMLSVAAIGMFSTEGTFWTLPTAFLSGPAAAAGIAVINSIGNLAGFLGPFAIGALKDATGSFAAGLFAVGAIAAAGVAVVLLLPRQAVTPGLVRHPD